MAPTVAFRCWQSVVDDRLQSMARQYYWEVDGPVKAGCLADAHVITGKHVAPGEDCTCGLYVYSDFRTLRMYTSQFSHRATFHGAVVIWGTSCVGRVKATAPSMVDLGEKSSSTDDADLGYRLRVEYAQVIALEKGLAPVEELAQRSGIPTVAANYLEAWVADVYGGERYRQAG